MCVLPIGGGNDYDSEGNTNRANMLLVHFAFVIVHNCLNYIFTYSHTSGLPLFHLQISLHVHQHRYVINWGNQSCLYALRLSCQANSYQQLKQIPGTALQNVYKIRSKTNISK